MINQTNVNGSLAADVKDLAKLRQAAKENSPEALKATAKQFEALMMNMVLKSMREATPKDGLFDSEQGKIFGSMLDQQLSQTMANRGMGLADILVRQLSNNIASKAALPKPSAEVGDTAAAMAPSTTSATAEKSTTDTVASTSRVSDIVAASAAARSYRKPAHVQAFQDKLSAHAEQASLDTGIPAKFMLGQAALESGWGKHEIRNSDGSSSHNLFGIKADRNWKGRVAENVTTEYVNGVPRQTVAKFRAYDSYADSFRDYASLLKDNPRYEKVLASGADARGFAQGLQKAGYATDPRYADKLASLITRSFSA
jgi:flagellar protein FlgJ